LSQVLLVRITREAIAPGLPVVVEDHHYVTSLSAGKLKGSPKALLALVREHWEIENRLHHTKDRSLAEDADRNRRGAPILSRLRSLAIGLLEYVAGDSVPQKQIRISADPTIVTKLLARKRLEKHAVRL
jgi:hypothetical protein